MINISELYKNFVPDTTFECIRWKGDVKVYDSDVDIPKMKSRKDKIINYEGFQNTIEIFIQPSTDSTTKKRVQVKLFANGSFTLTGCNDCKTPYTVMESLRHKINETPGATSHSEMSKIINQTIKLDKTFSQGIRFIMINASARCNIKLTSTMSDQHGLVELQKLFIEKYPYLLIEETHKSLKSHQTPCKIPPPGMKSSKRLIVKFKHNLSVVTLQWHTNGSLCFTATTSDALIHIYDQIYNIIHDPSNVSPTTRQLVGRSVGIH